MRIRLSDIIDEDVNEIASLNKRKNDRASNNRIREMVMDEVGEPRKKFRLKKSIIIPIAAVLALFCATAIAANYSTNFRLFLKQNFGLFEDKIQVINHSVSNGRITMTVESAINLGSSSMTLVKFTKDDGSSFSRFNDFRRLGIYQYNDEETSYFEYMKKPYEGYINFKEKVDTEDDKALYYVITLANASDVTEQDYTIFADDLEYRINSVIKPDVNMAELLEKYPLTVEDGNYDIDVQNFGINVVDEYCPVTFEGIARDGDKLYLYFETPKKLFSEEQRENVYMNEFGVAYLYNEETDSYVEVSNRYKYDSPLSADMSRYCTEIDISRIDDLSGYDILTIVHYYAFMYDDHLKGKETQESGLSAAVKFDKGEQSIDKVFEESRRIRGTRYELDKLSLSRIGLYVEGNIIGDNWRSFNGLTKLPINLVYENGETLELNRSYMGQMDLNRLDTYIYSEYYSLSEGYVEGLVLKLGESLNYKFPARYDIIDIENVVAVQIGEETIELR